MASKVIKKLTIEEALQIGLNIPDAPSWTFNDEMQCGEDVDCHEASPHCWCEPDILLLADVTRSVKHKRTN